jgi:hypothetical protein
LFLAEIESIRSVAYEEAFLEESDPVIHFESDAHGPIQFCPRDMNLFSDLESLRESGLLTQIDEQEFGQLVRQAMTYLDDADIWRSVEVVAEELLAVGSVSGVRFVKLMASAKS